MRSCEHGLRDIKPDRFVSCASERERYASDAASKIEDRPTGLRSQIEIEVHVPGRRDVLIRPPRIKLDVQAVG